MGDTDDSLFVTCPYNSQHRVTRLRIQSHIVKCQEKYPELKICPYNATHRMSAEELKIHVISCPTRLENFAQNIPKTRFTATPQIMAQNDTLSDDEVWD